MNYNETAIKLFELLATCNAADSDNAESWQRAGDASFSTGAYGDVNRALVKLVGRAAVDHWCETGEIDPALFCRQPAKPTTVSLEKPYCTHTYEVLGHVDKRQPVHVYYNLRKQCFSVMQGGIVRCHTESLFMYDVRYVVREAGRKRVLQERKKNVHAFVVGHVGDKFRERAGHEPRQVSYNPYHSGDFETAASGPVDYTPHAMLSLDDDRQAMVVGYFREPAKQAIALGE